MMLGEDECDYETMYFLKHGRYPKIKRNGKIISAKGSDIDDYLYREFQLANFNEYFTPLYRYVLYGK